MSPFALLPIAYLMGSVPTSLWVGRVFHGIDLRTRGSGNLGATNTLRVLGWKAALPVMLVDVAKGWIPAAFFLGWSRAGTAPEWALGFGAAAIIGHVFSVWARFKGGKGVATSAGAFIGLAPLAVLMGLGVWLVVVFSTRIVSLGSISAAVALPFVVWLGPGDAGGPLLMFTVALAVFVVWAHRSNIGRLMRGEEKRFSRADPTGGEA